MYTVANIQVIQFNQLVQMSIKTKRKFLSNLFKSIQNIWTNSRHESDHQHIVIKMVPFPKKKKLQSRYFRYFNQPES